MSWSIVVPVKRLAVAKTRLYGAGVALPERRALVLALAADTVTAALASAAVGRVFVVTDEPEAADLMRTAGAVVLPDRPDAGLNPAVAYGAAVAAEQAPADGAAVLASDLPALRPGELAEALAAAGAHPRAFVADAAGLGTALLTAAPGHPLDPRYGPASRHAHAGSGAVELTGDWPSLRRDVDTPHDLTAARALGVGSATRDVLVGAHCEAEC